MTRRFEPNERPLAALVGLAFNRLSTGLMAHVHAAGFDDLRIHHFLNVFRFLPPDGIRPARLAEAAGITPQAMSLVVSELKDLGYVKRGPDPTDRRSHLVTWSERGLAAGTVVERWYAELEAKWTREVGARNVNGARRVLAAIVEAQR